MEKFIPYQKLSKKEKRKLDAMGRKNWGFMCPVTRKPANSRAYDRKKWKNRKDDLSGSFFVKCWDNGSCTVAIGVLY